MIFEDKQGSIEVRFIGPRRWDKMIGIHLDFSLKGVGWGSVGGEAFSLNAIKALSENLAEMLAGQKTEFHISEDGRPEIIPKPFYWLDFIKKGDRYEAHIMIHNMLEDYIEATEMIDETKLREFQTECREAYEKFKDESYLNEQKTEERD